MERPEDQLLDMLGDVARAKATAEARRAKGVERAQLYMREHGRPALERAATVLKGQHRVPNKGELGAGVLPFAFRQTDVSAQEPSWGGAAVLYTQIPDYGTFRYQLEAKVNDRLEVVLERRAAIGDPGTPPAEQLGRLDVPRGVPSQEVILEDLIKHLRMVLEGRREDQEPEPDWAYIGEAFRDAGF